jgi:hypothetical protein
MQSIYVRATLLAGALAAVAVVAGSIMWGD